MMNTNVEDKKFIETCIKNSEISAELGNGPFAAMIVKDSKIISSSQNNSAERISDHAEILALDQAHKITGSSNLEGYTLYSNCEPCPMCSFMAREYKISRIVFSVHSPFVGGYSKWDIMQNSELEKLDNFFSKTPEIVGGVLEDKGIKIFEKLGWWMFGNKSDL